MLTPLGVLDIYNLSVAVLNPMRLPPVMNTLWKK